MIDPRSNYNHVIKMDFSNFPSTSIYLFTGKYLFFKQRDNNYTL